MTSNMRDFSSLRSSVMQGPTKETGSGSGGRWTSGGSKEMPAAFGGGDRDKKRIEAKATAARESASVWAKKQADIKEEKRLADLCNFTSEESYPSLGGPSLGSSKPVAKAPPLLNFKKTVEEMAVRVAADEEQQARRAAAIGPVKKVLPPAPYTHYGDDGPEDYDGPDEGGEEGEEGNGEFNAEIYSTRRRGDKGIW